MEQLTLRLVGRPTLPKCRGDCLATVDQRANGEFCEHLTCRHNLIGEITRMGNSAAATLASKYIRGEILDSCALDVADRDNGDAECRKVLGLTQNMLEKESDKARESLRTVLRQDPHLAETMID